MTDTNAAPLNDDDAPLNDDDALLNDDDALLSQDEDEDDEDTAWDDADPRARALSILTGTPIGDIEEEHGTVYSVGRAEYSVMTDDEADEAWDESLDNYLDECVLPELPGNLRYYFDCDAWKRDARSDGRGHCLSGYDGSEQEATDPVTGEAFVVFRVS